MNDQGEDTEYQFEKSTKIYNEFIRPRLEQAEKAYNQALTSLWLGNGADALATLSFIGGVSRGGSVSLKLIVTLCLFVLGLISMVVGSLHVLLREASSINSMLNVNATSVLDFRLRDIQRPVERAGLTFGDCRTRMAILSAVFFISGCIFGLFALTCQH